MKAAVTAAVGSNKDADLAKAVTAFNAKLTAIGGAHRRAVDMAVAEAEDFREARAARLRRLHSPRLWASLVRELGNAGFRRHGARTSRFTRLARPL